jgi:hypothetical protein
LLKLDFEKNVEGWVPSPGMNVAQATEGHDSPASLPVAGRQPGKTWAYAYLPLGKVLQAGARYRVTCWMKVADWSDPKLPPYAKLGLNDARDQWITNVVSNRYDLARQGQWQQLVIDCDMPLSAEQSVFAIERGEFESPTSGTIWIDDLAVELLESP